MAKLRGDMSMLGPVWSIAVTVGGVFDLPKP
jgi:hypothetical protein